MTNEQEVQKRLVLLEYYKEQLNTIDMQTQYQQAALADLHKAKMTLENLDSVDTKTDMLIPIGGGAFIATNPSDTTNVLIDIGAGYVVEKKGTDAIKQIEKQIKQVEENQEKLLALSQQLQNEAAEVSRQAEELTSQQK